MIKVSIDYDKISSLNKSKKIENLFDGHSATILYEGEDNGIYYLKNYKKDELRKITKDDTIELLSKEGYTVSKENFYINNVLLKRAVFDDIYIVKPLDTLEKISNLLNLEKEIIIKLNNLKTEKLFIGQQLKIMS